MKKTLILLLLSALTLLLFEFFLRFSPFSYDITPMKFDNNIGMWHKKDFSAYITSDCYKTKYSFDSEGRIKNNYELSKNKKDIVLLGDSQIESLMVKNDNVLNNKLYNHLNGKYNVFNYALSGTASWHQYQILVNKVNKTNVKTLIQFISLPNEIYHSSEYGNTQRSKVKVIFKNLDNFDVIKPVYSFKERIRDFIGHFEIYVYLKKIIESFKRDSNNVIFDLNKYDSLQTFGSIYQISKIAKANKFDYIVVIYDGNGYLKYIEELNNFKDFLLNRDIKFIDIRNDINSLKSPYFNCDDHWNETFIEIISLKLKNIINE